MTFSSARIICIDGIWQNKKDEDATELIHETDTKKLCSISGDVMINFLFWNTYGTKEINSYIESLVHEFDINIIVLAEYNADVGDLLMKINNGPSSFTVLENAVCKKVTIISNCHATNNILRDGKNYSIHEIEVFGKALIVAAVHLPSKYLTSEATQHVAIDHLVNAIGEAEGVTGHNNTIVVGDFNQNPFESGMIYANYLHSLPSRKVAMRQTRTVQSDEYKMFYNPMWNLFGDHDKPPGTYFYSDSNADCFFWNIYDQVILRPCVINSFLLPSLKIVTNTQQGSLIQNDKPNKNISDHLPICFSIEEGNLL